MVAYWRVKCPQAGRYKHGREVVGDGTAKSRLGCVKVTESQFANDVAVYATSRDAFESVTVKLVDAGQWALRTTGTIWHRDRQAWKALYMPEWALVPCRTTPFRLPPCSNIL